MAHKLTNIQLKDRKRKFFIPKIDGKFGISFSVGGKEVFIGVAVSDVILEQIIKKRVVKIPKADTRTYGFDPFSADYSDKE